MTVSLQFYLYLMADQRFDHVGLGSVVVFSATMFALWSGVTNGLAAIVIVQAGIFAEASRQLVRLFPFVRISALS